MTEILPLIAGTGRMSASKVCIHREPDLKALGAKRQTSENRATHVELKVK